jgi:glycosyltransferase involved in cell wall biosynthesis
VGLRDLPSAGGADCLSSPCPDRHADGTTAATPRPSDRHVHRLQQVHQGRLDCRRAARGSDRSDPARVETSSYPRATDESRRFARRALGVPADAFVTLYLGRVAPEKGVDVLVRAWNSLGLTPDEGRLLIVGPPWPWSYLEDLHRLVSASCLFMDLQTHVVPLLHAADVLVLPSRWEEPFGRVIIEAMATGCPVIASRVGGIPEILTGDFASMLCEPGRAEELASKLGEIRRGAGGALAAAGPAHVRKNFALSSAADRVEKILVQATPRGWRASS